MPSATLTDAIISFALEDGAAFAAVAPVETYAAYLAEVHTRLVQTGAGVEDYMIAPGDADFFERLANPRRAMSEANSIILIGVYAYDEEALYRNTRADLRGKTARTYSYYPVARQIAESLSNFIRSKGYEASHGQDIPLKFAAARLGLGAYGKNGLLLTHDYGSYVALRAVLTDASLRPRAPAVVGLKPHPLCSDCERCLKACPTGALYAPGKVNPRLCINPVTRRSEMITIETRRAMRNWICGCDICQEVCPANRNLKPREADPRSGFDPANHASHRDLGGLEKSPPLLELLAEHFPYTIRRNAAIALANTAQARRTEATDALNRHMPSSGDLGEYFNWARQVLVTQ